DFISTADLNSRFIEPLTTKGCEVVLIVDACHASGLNRNLSGGVEGGKITMMALENMTSPVKMYSCQASQYSLESEQWGGGRGLFSYVLMEGLYGMADADNNKVVSLREIQRYLEDNVPTLASPNKQDPIIKIDNPKRAISKVNDLLLNEYKVQKSKNLPFMARADIKGGMDGLIRAMDTTRQRLYRECDSLINVKELEKAYAVFKAYAQLDSTSEVSLQLRRNLSASLQEKTAAILTPMLEDASKVDVTREEVMLAIDDLEKATELLGPANFLYKNLVARKLFLQAFVIKKFNVKGNPDAALAMLEESAKLEPNAPYTYYYMGLFHRDKNDKDKSKKNFKQYVDLIPSSGWAYNNLGYSDVDAGSFDEAINNYQQAIRIFKDSTGKKGRGYVTSMNNLGMVYTKLGQYDKAEPLFVDANKFKVDMVTVMGFPGFPGIPGMPDSMHGVNNLGKLYVRKGDYDKAEPILVTSSEEAKKIFGPDHPAYARTIVDIGELKGKTGNYDKAIEYFDEALTIMDKVLGADNPRSGEIYFQKGVIYVMEKNNAQALENFEKAFQMKYHDLKNIELNKSLDPIRTTPAFKKLLKKYFSEKELDRHSRMFSAG
ncbi:MAG TPA: tetratricopeptide repeat protein, partial [Chitinophagaceae bacterium]|nr:tetratricopeptide repeat protein [Chitinophagaceae bacterium]